MVLLSLVVIGTYESGAQSLRGKIIYVHPTQVVKLKFRSSVDNYSFVNKSESKFFNVKLAKNKTFVINSLGQKFRTSNLVITEGENTHLFILVYKSALNEDTETFYDFSKKNTTPAGSNSMSQGTAYAAKPEEKADKPAPATTQTSNAVTPKKTVTAEAAPELSANTENATHNAVYVSTPVNNNTPAPKEVTVPKKEIAFPSYTVMDDSARYDLYVHLGDSAAWIVKDYKTALKWYDSAAHIRPQAALPRRQSKAVKQLLTQAETTTAIKMRNDRFNTAMQHYTKAEAFKTERKFAEAHGEYRQFLQQIDTVNLNAYKSSELYYINAAKDYVVRLQHYVPKPKAEPPPPVQEQPVKKGKRKNRSKS